MTNLNKNQDADSIHFNNEEASTLSLDELFDFIQRWLPRNYSHDVNLLLPADKRFEDTTYIRQVKRERISNPLIVNALYRHAQFNRLQLEGAAVPEVN